MQMQMQSTLNTPTQGGGVDALRAFGRIAARRLISSTIKSAGHTIPIAGAVVLVEIARRFVFQRPHESPRRILAQTDIRFPLNLDWRRRRQPLSRIDFVNHSVEFLVQVVLHRDFDTGEGQAD